MNIWEEVCREFDSEIERLKISLGNGSAEDYSHYRQLVGSISGLEWEKTNLTDIVKKRMYSEE